MKNIWTTIMLVMLFTSCNKPEEAPEFLRVDNIRVNKVTGKEALLNADAFFYNPNDMNMKLKAVDIEIQLDGERIGTINQTMKSRIPAMSEFKVPLDATFDMHQVGLLNGIMSILGGKPLDVHYSGSIKVAVYGINYNVPVEFDDSVRL